MLEKVRIELQASGISKENAQGIVNLKVTCGKFDFPDCYFDSIPKCNIQEVKHSLLHLSLNCFWIVERN